MNELLDSFALEMIVNRTAVTLRFKGCSVFSG